MDKYLAKTKPVVKDIYEHTKDVLDCFEYFVKLYEKYFSKEELELVKIAIKVHDLGKINYFFRKKMYRLMGWKFYIGNFMTGRDHKYQREIPHGFLSALFIDFDEIVKKYGNDYAIALITAVYNHHLREDTFSDDEFYDAVKFDLRPQFTKYTSQYGNISDCSVMATNIRHVCIRNDGIGRYISEELWCKYVVIKGLLNKMDYYASACNDQYVEIPADHNGKYLSDYILAKFGNNLREVQKYMFDNKDKSLVVTASTGIGKTEGALLWLDSSKGFYTLPLKVSINAIYKRILEEYSIGEEKYPPEKVGLLHSDALSYLLDNKEDDRDDDSFLFTKYRKAKMFSHPITLCTADQIFRFVFKHIGDEIIPATLKYSKVIIDEIQMYSPQTVAYMIYGLKIIDKLGGKFLIMTATFPPIFKELISEQGINCQFSQPYYSHVAKRHFIKVIYDDFDLEKIKREGKDKKVLVLCNTVKKAQQVYEALSKDESSVWLLHSLFIKKHRRILEDSIISFSKARENCGIWISTQIVEASLDIDFDILFTEMCSADSLLQRMGRCYRSRIYNGTEPNVFIYVNNNGRGSVYDKEIYDLSVKHLDAFSGGIFNEHMKQAYVEMVYNCESIKKNAPSYYQTIKGTLDDINKLLPAAIERSTAHRLFRDIQSITVIPDSIYKKLKDSGEYDRLANLINDKSANYIEKLKAINEFSSNLLSINNKHNVRKICDRAPLSIRNMEVYRSQCAYDFIEETISGRGFITGEHEISNFL